MVDGVKTQRGLTTERVVDAALRLADESGIEAVSLRHLAEALGVTPMAIYRHVRDKDHLLDLMADLLLQQLDLGPAELPTWQDGLRQIAANFLAMHEAHPAAPLLLSRPFVSPAALRLTEALLAILDSAGFGPAESVQVLQVITGMLLGPAIHRSIYGAARQDLPLDAASERASKEELSPDEYPYLSNAQEQLVEWSSGPEADRLTIELVVAGVMAFAERSTEARSPKR